MSSVRNAEAVIVIFGAAVRPDGRPSEALRQRVEAAVAFGERFTAPLYLPTGAMGRFGASEAAVMADLLHASGVSADSIMIEDTGTDTLSSVRAVAALVDGLDLPGPLYVATSGYHQPRCVLLLWLAGHHAVAIPPPPAPVQFRHRWYWRARELLAVPYDAGLMLGLRLLRRV
jgi:uncharacterized SAM-binding protein YcdF (DUF218 family)